MKSKTKSKYKTKTKSKSKSKTKSKSKQRTMNLSISKKRYKTLLLQHKKKTLTKKQRHLLDQALYVNYCRCIRSFETKKDPRGYGICMSSVYKQRNIDPPKQALQNCKIIFQK